MRLGICFLTNGFDISLISKGFSLFSIGEALELIPQNVVTDVCVLTDLFNF